MVRHTLQYPHFPIQTAPEHSFTEEFFVIIFFWRASCMQRFPAFFRTNWPFYMRQILNLALKYVPTIISALQGTKFAANTTSFLLDGGLVAMCRSTSLSSSSQQEYSIYVDLVCRCNWGCVFFNTGSLYFFHKHVPTGKSHKITHGWCRLACCSSFSHISKARNETQVDQIFKN